MKLAGPVRRSNYSANLLTFLAVIPHAVAQNAVPGAPARPLGFDVISIRPSAPGTHGKTSWVTTPDAYRVIGQSLRDTILIAYFPRGYAYWSPDRFSGAPPWLSGQYDIVAKVSEADLAEWQKQGVTLDEKPMLSQMLRTMLADRCNLAAHTVPGPPISGWSLQVSKRGPRLTESKPGATLPPGVPLPHGGGVIPLQSGENPHVSFYAATIGDFANFLSMGSAGHPVQDQTGLTGHYDFVVNWEQDPNSRLPAGFLDPNDLDPLSHLDIDALGLQLVRIKVPADTLVIDHIEKPSEN